MSEGDGKRIGPFELIRGAAALLARKWPAVVTLWLLTAALLAGPRLAAAAMPYDASGMRAMSNGEFYFTLASPVLVAWMAALLFRAVLTPPTGKTPEGGAWLHVLVIGGLAAALAWARLMYTSSGLPIQQITFGLGAGDYAMKLLGPVFALWPIGIVMGGPARSLGEAVRAMQGAYLAFLIAAFLIAVVPVVASSGLTMLAIRTGTRPGPDLILVGSLISAALKFLGYLLAAEIFRRRYLAKPDVGAVFD